MNRQENKFLLSQSGRQKNKINSVGAPWNNKDRIISVLVTRLGGNVEITKAELEESHEVIIIETENGLKFEFENKAENL